MSRSNLLTIFWIALCGLFMTSETIHAQDLTQVLLPSEATESNPQEPKTIPVESDLTTDLAIESRLNELISTQTESETVEVTVDSGVVTLSGKVLANITKGEVAGMVSQVEGVAKVINNIEVERDVDVRVHHVWDTLKNRVLELISYLPLLALAAVVMFLFWLLSRSVLSWNFLFGRFTNNIFLVDLAKQATRGAILLVGLLIALEILDATALLGSLMGAVGLIGLAIGFAVKDTVENYIASILLSLRQPFSPNDHIIIDSYEGKVLRLTSRATILMTFDGNHIRIPNAIVYKGVLINYSRNPERPLSFEVGVGASVELTSVRALALQVLEGVNGVLSSPAPSCQIKEIGDFAVVLSLFAWTDQSRFDFSKVRSACIQAVKNAYDETGIDMPEPTYRLLIPGGTSVESNTAGLQSAGEEFPVESISIAVDEHMAEVADVSKDEELDLKIAEEAAKENDLLNESASKE